MLVCSICQLSVCQPAWYSEIVHSYSTDTETIKLKAALALKPESLQNYSLDNNGIRHKQRIWLGINSLCRGKSLMPSIAVPWVATLVPLDIQASETAILLAWNEKDCQTLGSVLCCLSTG
jgi:hypothetical protein